MYRDYWGPSTTKELIPTEEALALSESQICTNIRHAITSDKLNEVFTYAANKIDLCKQEYFQCALRHSLRIFKYLIMLYPGFVNSQGQTVEVWTHDTWLIVMNTDYKTIKYVASVCGTGQVVIDNLLAGCFGKLTNQEQLELFEMILRIGCTVQDQQQVIKTLMRDLRQGELLVDMLLDKNLLHYEFVLDYWIPEHNYSRMYHMYERDSTDRLLRLFLKYKVITDVWSPGEPVRAPKKYRMWNLDRTRKSHLYRVIELCVHNRNIKMLTVLHNSGYHMKHLHFRYIHGMEIVKFIVENHEPNKYQRFIKYILYHVDIERWDSASNSRSYTKELNHMKTYTEWMAFFSMFSARVDQYSKRGNISQCRSWFHDAVIARDELVKHLAQYKTHCVNVLHLKHNVPKDVVEHVVFKMLW